MVLWPATVFGQSPIERPLVVGGDNDYPPYEFIDQHGRPSGYNVDMFNAVAEVMGLKAQLRLGPWNEVRQALEKGENDVIIGMFNSPERGERVDFSSPHLIIHQSIFIRKGSPIKGEQDLAGKWIIVQRGDIMHDYVRNKKLSTHIVLAESQPQGLRWLAAGRYDCFLGVTLQGLVTITQYKLTNLETAGTPFYPRQYGFAVKKGDAELLAVLNEGLSIVKQTGRFDAIYKKWFGVIDPKLSAAPKVVKYLTWIISPILVALLVSFLLLRSLKRQVALKTKGLQSELEKRIEVEKELQKRESILRATLESTHDGILVVSPEGRLTHYNKRFVQIWEVPEHLLDTGNDKQLLSYALTKMENPEQFIQRINELYQSVKISEDLIQLKDGRIIERFSCPLVEEGATETGRIWFFRDITERKRAEEELKASEEQFRTAMEANPDPVVLYDMQERVVFFNHAFTRVFGWTLAERMGGKLDDFVPEDDRPAARAMIDSLLRGEQLSDLETYRMNKAGERIPVIISGSIFTDSKGRQIGNIINLRDAREQRKLQYQLQQAYKMEAIGTLAGGIAHDFNNILSAMLGYCELAMEQTGAENELGRYLEQILKAGQRAKDLVNQILAFSRQTDQVVEPIRLASLVREVIKLLRASLPTTIDIQHQINSKAFVMGDPTQIHQVLMNLCTNAAHAMSESEGMLEIRLDDTTVPEVDPVKAPDLSPGRYVRLAVIDTGHGIQVDIMDRIFDPFFTTKQKGKGTGMGLAVVHGIIKSYNGAITVDSRFGEGAAFFIYLPIVEAETQAKPNLEEPIVGGGERLLLVDDETLITDVGQHMLATLGYQVTTFNSSTEALKRFTAGPDDFDIVITDMTMPRMTGDVLAGRIRRIRPNKPIIICTGYSDKIDEHQARSLGISAFIKKPFLRKQIALAIRKALDNETSVKWK